MLRLTEIGFFLVPFGLFLAWRVLGDRTPRWALGLAIVLTAALAAGTVWFGLHTGLPPEQRYEPAHMEGGVIVPGHGVDAPHRR